MGQVCFRGEPPFELAVQSHPTAHAEADDVIVTMAVFAPGLPVSTADIQVRLTLEHAAKLADYLGPAMRNAREQRGLQS